MPQDGDAAAAAAASADDLVPAIWNASENEALCQTEFDVPEDWQPSGDFAKDYLFYVKLLGILPHPDLWRVKRPRARLFEDGEFVENDEAEDDEDDFDQSDAPSSVAIRHHNVDAATLKAMCLVLPSTLSLVQLRFYNAGLTAVDLNMVVKALSGSSVTSLSIEYNPLSDIAPIQDQEAKITGEVDDAPKTSEGAEAANSDEDIRDNAGVDPSTQFAACLDLPIASLSLRGNGITPSGAAAIAKKLYDHKTLNSLNLFDNNIEGEGAQALLDMLYCNRSVTHLVLARNNVPAGILKTALLPVCDVTVPDRVAQIRKELGLAYSESQKKPKKKKKKRAGQGLDLDLPTLYKNEEGSFLSEINGNIQAIDLSYNRVGKGELASVIAPLAGVVNGAVDGDAVGLQFLGLARVGGTAEEKEQARKVAQTALSTLQLSL